MIWIDVALLFFIEVLEANLQKGRTFSALVTRLYTIRSHSLLRFLSMHISLIYVLFYATANGVFNGWMALIVLIKGVDLGMKFWLFDKMDKNGGVFSTEQFYGVPDMEVSATMRYAGAIAYSVLFAAAISPTL